MSGPLFNERPLASSGVNDFTDACKTL